MARSLGIPPGELAGRISGNDLTLWRAYERIEPPDVSLLYGILSAVCVVGNLLMAKGRKLTPDDFLPRYGTPKPRIQPPEEGKAIFAAMVARMKASQGLP